MDGPRRGHGRRPSSSSGGGGAAANADPRRAAAAREAMARMEELMLAHAGAAGEFSIILDAPLPSLQQYRRNPAPPPKEPSPYRRNGAQNAGRRDEGVPARLRREGSLPDAVGDADAARAYRRSAGAAGPRPYAADEEAVQAPVRLVNPRGARRPPSRGETTPPRVAEVRRVVAEEEEQEETPVRLVDPRGARRPPSRGETPPPRVAEVRRVVTEEEKEEEETPLQLLARGGRSSSATRPAEVPREVEAVAATARPSSRRSSRDSGVEAVAADVTANVNDEMGSVGRGSSRGSVDSGEEAAALPKPLAAMVTGDRSRSSSPAISNVKVCLPSQFV